MEKDPIVEEVRKAGARIAEKCGFDADVFISRLRINQKKSRRKVVSFSNPARGKHLLVVPYNAEPGNLKCAEDRIAYKTGRK